MQWKKLTKQFLRNAISDVAKELLESSDNNYVHELADFVINTKRGIPFNRKQEK